MADAAGFSPADEQFVPHTHPRDRVPMATHVRGTVILSSLRSIRARGLEKAYLAALEPKSHLLVASLTAPTWLPVSFALAHYDACGRLDLDRHTIDEIGAEAGRFINQTVLTVVSKLSIESGMTPWFALAHAPKLVARTWQGSSVAVWRIGPKDARLDWVQQPLARIPYFRAAFRSFAAATIQLFARTCFVREVHATSADTEVAYRLSWA